MPIDERSDLDRLSRFDCYREADAWGIKYPPDLPKYIWKDGQVMGGMVALLQSQGVNRTNMKTIQWHTVVPTDQERAAAAHQGVATSEQSYPVRPVHQSARDGVDSMAILQDRLAKSEARGDLQKDELTRLKNENASLREALSRLDQLEAKLGTAAAAPPARESGQKRRMRLMKLAKDRGLEVDNTATLAELEKLLGENAG